MNHGMVTAALYGKGGIGKSTIAANVSAALAKTGKNVLHIGCDPKADSTRCLTGRRIPSVMEQINAKGDTLTAADIVYSGVYGVRCVEAGGPQAGSGCAGMGIVAMAAELNRLGILDQPWDVVIYDVLGDVVCGGFAVPIRQKLIQKVYVVSSADFMSLYAANNIMKGVCRFASANGTLFGGLIQNHAVSKFDRKIVRDFAARTGVELIQTIPECTALKFSDYKRQTVSETFEASDIAQRFQELAQTIYQNKAGSLPHPMDDQALETFSDLMLEWYRDSEMLC